ncbi:restriction endonuclease subunit S [Priestia aryabhattai]|uniref:restriction endonuclease subunit S n=1 Tax=Priestia aryabhattai TaxID=412384 RepID=UPI0027E4939C|nr:restriction endonuclease subunit S [Priestia aryabhattai]WJW97221.1 restriction endonuclease subunit S [Priestia aryabhattai]
MKLKYENIGKYIQKVNVRNTDLRVKNLLGINIDKYFMPSVANIVGTDMTKYKIVKKGQFACNRMHVGRDKRLPVALSKQTEDIIVSPAYDVFEIIDKEVLDSEYLMMWFLRKEFDRNAWFYTDADVRGGLNWESFCNMQIPVPSIRKQKEIVKEYNVLVNRENLNNRIIERLEESAQTIYKQWFVDFEFPTENEKPYKSSDGQMEFNEELDKEIPKGWEIGELGDFIDVVNGFAFESDDFQTNGTYPIIKIANIKSPYVELESSQYYSGEVTNGIRNCFVGNGDILITMTGSHMNQINSAVGKIGRYNHKKMAILNQRVGKLKPKPHIPCKEFIYRFMLQEEIQKELLMGATGSANQANISASQIKSIRLPKPPNRVIEQYENVIGRLNRNVMIYEAQNRSLRFLKDLLLSKLVKMEDS